MFIDATTRALIALALAEDVGHLDLTAALLPEELQGCASLLAKSGLVFFEGGVVAEVYRQLDPRVEVEIRVGSGTKVSSRTVLGQVRGPARSLLTGERLMLNILQRLCAIATATRRAVDAVAGTRARIVDTRKTTPALRALEKQAVRAGGGVNHRFGLFDGILIKDNHVAALGGVGPAIRAARSVGHHLLKIECEVTTLAELEEALAEKAEVVLLDNMNLEQLKDAVRINAGRALLEASGNMTLERLPEVAATGVDLISMGALTHSVSAADISLEWGLG